jgi:hypothetical protein
MRRFLAALGIAVLTLTPALPASAEQAVHPDIAAALASVEGGVATGYYEAHWPAHHMTMTVPAPYVRAVGSCATGTFCAFTGLSMTGNKLSWGTCTTGVPYAGFTTRSIANARAGGSVVQARNGTAIVASAVSGASTNVTGTVTNIRCLE